MKIVVCVKQIPDPANPGELDPSTHFLIRPQEQILDDTDRYGVEVGLQLAEADEGSVAVVSMGPAGNLQGIRQALAMGADKAILVSDEALRGSAALVTARVLAAAITREGFDLVIAGTESTDGYSGVVPQMLSELLDVPALTFSRKVAVADGTIKVERQTMNGYEEVEATPPALLTVTAGVVEPRYPTFKGIMAAKSKPIEQLTAAELGFDAAAVGPTGSHQEIAAVKAAPERSGGTKIEDEGEAFRAIIEKLEQVKAI